MYLKFKLNLRPIYFVTLFVGYYFLFFNQTNVLAENGQQNPFSAIADYNIVAVGDFSCNEDAKKTVLNMINIDPELLLGLGDYSYETSAKCWKDIVGGIDSQKIKISFGNHEFEDESLLKQYMDYTNLDNQYYSFDRNNVHFISMATEVPYEQGSEQFEFVKHDLMKTKTNSSIDWIIVYYHQPMYTSKTIHEGLESLRDLYHSLFHEYGVDLVLQGHVHNYQRTYPLIYNSENPSNPTITQSAILDFRNNEENIVYEEDEGPVFAIVGTGGRELHGLDDQAYFTATQLEEHGFLEVKTINNGKSLVGQFYSNNGNIIKDKFIIEKSTSTVNRTLDDDVSTNNLVICDKLISFGHSLLNEWEQGHLTGEQALLLGEHAKILMTESRCIN